MFIFTLICGASEDFMKAFKVFIKLFEAPQRRVKTKIQINFLSSSGMRMGRVKMVLFKQFCYLNHKLMEENSS